MTDAIYEWMKNLAVFYIFLTVVLNLAPDGRYRDQLKFFMGLLLLLLILSPLLRFFRLDETLNDYLQQNMREQAYLDSSYEEMQERLMEREEEIKKKLDKKYGGTTEDSEEGMP